jgi:hypothetical protein
MQLKKNDKKLETRIRKSLSILAIYSELYHTCKNNSSTNKIFKNCAYVCNYEKYYPPLNTVSN